MDRDELEAVDPAEPVWPVEVLELLDRALSQGRSVSLADLGRCEESTVPA